MGAKMPEFNNGGQIPAYGNEVGPHPDPTQAPGSESSRPDALQEAPRSATEAWARKWLHFCRAYGIDPTTDYPDVVKQFDGSGELHEQVSEFFGLRPGIWDERCFVLSDGSCCSFLECCHGDGLTFKAFMQALHSSGSLDAAIKEGLARD